MITVGLDIGTTTICAIILDSVTGSVLESITEPNMSFIPTESPWEKCQDSGIIWQEAISIVRRLIKKHAPIGSIGVTGQMHGILYIDNAGIAVSPLYTWQDGRGNLPFKENESYASFLSNSGNLKIASGFGIATHFYNTINGLVPRNAVSICTIPDYIAMRLACSNVPVMHWSNAASLGFFDLEKKDFMRDMINKFGMNPDMFPRVTNKFEVIDCNIIPDSLQVKTFSEANINISCENFTRINNEIPFNDKLPVNCKIPVSVAIGDNQSSFIGSVNDMEHSLLVNVGTGSQISFSTKDTTSCEGVEIRPCTEAFINVGSSLCGGRAYALLENFFRQVVEMATGQSINDKSKPVLYPEMTTCLENAGGLTDSLQISTTFNGTRSFPEKRGCINNLGINNFTPAHFIEGVLSGIVDELYQYYCLTDAIRIENPSFLVGSGNGIRQNPILQKMFSDKFKMLVNIPIHKEEAAYGAALFSLVACGHFTSLTSAQKIIKYK